MKPTIIAALLLASIGIAHAGNSGIGAPQSPPRPPLSIAVNAQNGSTFRLVYTPGNGWRFADPMGPRLASVGSPREPTGPIQVPPDEIPQSVFVDGPSGYVFAYVVDEGWKFLGSVADAKR